MFSIYIFDILTNHHDYLRSRFIRSQLPVNNGLDHLKQIRRTNDPDSPVVLEIILCLESAMPSQELDQLIQKHNLTDVLKPRIYGVPLHPPLTRNQFEIWKAAWPTSFREDVTRHPEISDSELEIIMGHSRSNWERTKEAVSKGEVPCVATIVDSKTQQVLATAYDTRNSTKHILNHAVMSCIEAVAKRERDAQEQQQQKQVDVVESNAKTGSEPSTVSDETSSSSPACGEKRKEHPTSSEDTSKKPVVDAESQESGEENESEDSRSKKAYLCTGYDMYLTHEPCVMCSMALVHSRIGRVFYTIPMKASGGLGSALKIHSHPNLNHHFFTYQGVGLEEVTATEGGWDIAKSALDLENENMDC
ncbi:adenosine deaminase, tRNA-specific 3 [Entomortierella beljakovae]|nr:adenosine deaminase, tRNA-specific 3 [Entomortierella beljakovae]